MKVYTIVEKHVDGESRCVLTYSDPDVALEQLEVIAKLAQKGEWYSYLDASPKQDGKFFKKGDKSKTEIYIDGKLEATLTIQSSRYNEEFSVEE